VAQHAGAVLLRREGDGQVLCERCVIADTLPRRLRGLAGRHELPRGEGVVLRPGWSIHTAFVSFPIDVVFIDPDQVVRRVVSRLKPWRARLCRGARDVVELAAGECERLDLRAGDRVAWAARPERRLEAAPTPEKVRPSAESAKAKPTRVLLATRDDRFLRLARFLLTRNDFAVESTKRIAGAADLVERHRPDVVVVDATGDGAADAGGAVAAIEASHRDVSVVVVCDGDAPRWTSGLKVTQKWQALETLPQDVRLLAPVRERGTG
jgi:uncharacterized membrane protein (UPF0127 family)